MSRLFQPAHGVRLLAEQLQRCPLPPLVSATGAPPSAATPRDCNESRPQRSTSTTGARSGAASPQPSSVSRVLAEARAVPQLLSPQNLKLLVTLLVLPTATPAARSQYNPDATSPAAGANVGARDQPLSGGLENSKVTSPWRGSEWLLALRVLKSEEVRSALASAGRRPDPDLWAPVERAAPCSVSRAACKAALLGFYGRGGPARR